MNYVTNTGKIIKKVRRNTKYKFKRKMKSLSKKYSKNEVTHENVKQVLSSYIGHLKTWSYIQIKKVLSEIRLVKRYENEV